MEIAHWHETLALAGSRPLQDTLRLEYLALLLGKFAL